MRRHRAQSLPHMDANFSRAPVARPTASRADKASKKERQTLPLGESERQDGRDLNPDCHWLDSEDKASVQWDRQRQTDLYSGQCGAASEGDVNEDKTNLASNRKGRQVRRRPLAVIRQANEENRSSVAFLLETALSAGEPFVIVQDGSLASETRISISIGNFLHKGAVLSGLLCLCTGLLGTPRLAVSAGLLSGLCAILYDTSWAYDSCCQYQVARLDWWYEELPMTSQVDLEDLAGTTILVRKDDRVRRKLHNLLAGCSLGLCAVKICRPGPS